MTPTDLAQWIEAISLDIVTIRAHAAHAYDNIEANRGGYPATASGSDTGGGERTITVDIPCEGWLPCGNTECPINGSHAHRCPTPIPHTHPEQVVVTTTEALAINPPPDRADQAARRLENDLRDISQRVSQLARFCQAWYNPAVRDGEASRSSIPLDDHWCPNHRVHGHYVVRATSSDGTQRKYCGWCEELNNNPKYKRPPDSELIERAEKIGLRRLTTKDYDDFSKRIKQRSKKQDA